MSASGESKSSLEGNMINSEVKEVPHQERRGALWRMLGAQEEYR